MSIAWPVEAERGTLSWLRPNGQRDEATMSLRRSLAREFVAEEVLRGSTVALDVGTGRHRVGATRAEAIEELSKTKRGRLTLASFGIKPIRSSGRNGLVSATPVDTGSNGREAQKETAMATATKKAPARKAAAKKVPAKKAAPVKAASTRGQGFHAGRQETAQAIADYKHQGNNWDAIKAKFGLDVGLAQQLYFFHQQKVDGGFETPTPVKVKKDRDSGMSWVLVQAKYNIWSKGAAQKMYADAGGDPHATYIGRGGRYYDHEENIKHLRRDKTAEKAAKKAVKETAATTRSVFDEDADKDAILAKITGKKLTYRLTERMGGGLADVRVSDKSEVKVGTSKAGVRMVQFNDGDKARTVALGAIVKVSR